MELQLGTGGRTLRPTGPTIRAPGTAGENTHGQAVAGAGVTGPGESIIGVITLPAGGPWTIWGLWCMIAAATATPGESFGGNFRLNALEGDITPQPAPSRFPTGLGGSFLGATQSALMNLLKIWPVSYMAPGKGRIQMVYDEEVAVTVATQVVMGILFGKGFPDNVPIRFIDKVNAQVNAAANTVVGTITLAEKATRITHVGCQIAQSGTIVAGEELLGFFQLSSDDMNMAPAQFPMNAAFSAGLGVIVEQSIIAPPNMIPVDIPVLGGARVDCTVDLNTGVTNAAEVEVFIAYE